MDGGGASGRRGCGPRGRPAGPVGAQDDHDLPGVDGEGHPTEDLDLAVAGIEVLDLERSRLGGGRGQALVASLCAALTAYVSVRFLMRYFETRTLIPFAIWCLAFGAACSIYFAIT